ncbi:MAG: dihydrodipicolinate synthase family protein [Granulosicoccus sp.]
MSIKIKLPTTEGNLSNFLVKSAPTSSTPSGKWNRIGYAAAHVVADPLVDNNPSLDAAIDWDRTLGFREYLWEQGFGVAEAMDTAQRGMGLDWKTSLELIQRSTTMAKAGGHLIASGAGTDHLIADSKTTLNDVIAAYEMQCEAVEAAGSRIILMASRALALVAKGPDDYAKVYSHILGKIREPALIHWLGDMFDPALKGYWGSLDHMAAMDTCLQIINADSKNVDGIKVSLLSAEKEINMRRRLPEGVKMYSGDDFNYPDLIEGDEQGYSHALLGIFDPIAGAASRALSALGSGDLVEYRAAFDPTVPLSRHIFKPPTRFYKTGVVFMAYLNGHQDHFTLIGGQECCRSTVHLAEIIRLASDANLFQNADDVVMRARPVFEARGVEI